MAILLNRQNGQNYAENIVNPALSFNEGTWTVASGTGTATLVDASPFEGNKHLKLQNNTQATALVVGNSSQTTIIPFTANYQLSLFLRKSDPLSLRNLSVLVYQNAALLDTQVCVLGSGSAEDDINFTWVRFQGDKNYSFTKGDEITFQFSFAGTGGVAEQIEIDALMLNQSGRGNSIVPAYNKPIIPSLLPELPTTDGNYQLTVSSGEYSWTAII